MTVLAPRLLLDFRRVEQGCDDRGGPYADGPASLHELLAALLADCRLGKPYPIQVATVRQSVVTLDVGYP